MGNLCASLEETRAKAVAKLEQIPVGVFWGIYMPPKFLSLTIRSRRSQRPRSLDSASDQPSLPPSSISRALCGVPLSYRSCYFVRDLQEFLELLLCLPDLHTFEF